jgi:hypothetical protein
MQGLGPGPPFSGPPSYEHKVCTVAVCIQSSELSVRSERVPIAH